MQRLQYALEPNNEAVWQAEEKPLPPGFFTSDQAKEKILKDSNLIKRLITRSAYRFKDVIKSIPFLSRLATKIKNKFLEDVYEQKS